jgi:hypothetical protein
MGLFAWGGDVPQPKPPEKGVFPLDHFAECKQVRTQQPGRELSLGGHYHTSASRHKARTACT